MKVYCFDGIDMVVAQDQEEAVTYYTSLFSNYGVVSEVSANLLKDIRVYSYLDKGKYVSLEDLLKSEPTTPRIVCSSNKQLVMDEKGKVILLSLPVEEQNNDY